MKEQQYKNPTPTVDVVIEKDSQILLIKRKSEPFKDHLAFPGGFVNEGETVEDAARREAKEETSLDVDLIDILGVYSDPKRDPRGHIMSTVFIGKLLHHSNDKMKAVAKDDATDIEWINMEEVGNKTLGFDHKEMLLDYMTWKKSGGTFWSSKVRM